MIGQIDKVAYEMQREGTVTLTLVSQRSAQPWILTKFSVYRQSLHTHPCANVMWSDHFENTPCCYFTFSSVINQLTWLIYVARDYKKTGIYTYHNTVHSIADVLINTAYMYINTYTTLTVNFKNTTCRQAGEAKLHWSGFRYLYLNACLSCRIKLWDLRAAFLGILFGILLFLNSFWGNFWA